MSSLALKSPERKAVDTRMAGISRPTLSAAFAMLLQLIHA